MKHLHKLAHKLHEERKAATHAIHAVLHTVYFTYVVIEHTGLLSWVGGALAILTVADMIGGHDDA